MDWIQRLWHTELMRWAGDGKLLEAASKALHISRKRPPAELNELIQQLASGSFKGLPAIELLSAESLPTAAGAYAASSQTIYINQDWLQRSSTEQVLFVLTEEFGHHLDSLINKRDTPGDEGEAFALLLSQGAISTEELNQLNAENDHGVIEVNNQSIDVEFSTFTTNWTKAINLDGTNEYLVKKKNRNKDNPLRRGSTATNNPGSSRASSNGKPWATASVFRSDLPGTDQLIWGQLETTGNYSNISLIINSLGQIVFEYGDNNAKLQWTSDFTLTDSSKWWGFYIDYNGKCWGGSSGYNADDAYSRFRLRLVNLETDDDVTTPTGTWSNNGLNDGQTHEGKFYIGGHGSGQFFDGQIASTVITTLRTTNLLPTTTEINRMVRDPLAWLNSNKDNKRFRRPDETSNYSSFNFLQGSGGSGLSNRNSQSSFSTQVYLMGDEGNF
ncbi:MAG: hypothetical protein AB8E87_14860, partial [Prochlorococcus sp.]